MVHIKVKTGLRGCWPAQSLARSPDVPLRNGSSPSIGAVIVVASLPPSHYAELRGKQRQARIAWHGFFSNANPLDQCAGGRRGGTGAGPAGRSVNVLTQQVLADLEQAIDRIAAEKSFRLLIIRSGKPGTFIAGADVARTGGDTIGRRGSAFVAARSTDCSTAWPAWRSRVWP